MHDHVKKYTYNVEKYNFKEIIEYYLFDICKIRKTKLEDLVLTEEEQDRFYEVWDHAIQNQESKFSKILNQFCIDIVQPIFNVDLVIDRHPFFRFHLPNQKPRGSKYFHCDIHYNEDNYEWHKEPNGFVHILKYEKNFWLPLTKTYDTNSLWVESSFQKKDYLSVTSDYGEVINFNAVSCFHGTYPNKTNKTRVSFDFRIVEKEKWIDFLDKNKGNEDYDVNYYRDIT